MLQEYVVLFEVPYELPPSTPFDYSIPLVDGVVPVHIRPYRYAPQLKDEIEKQIQSMLQSGLIQKSKSFLFVCASSKEEG